jgi:thioredoxin 1
MLYINKENLEVLKTKKIICYFSAEWCGPCKTTSPIFEQLAEEPKYKNKIEFAKIDVGNSPEIANQYKLRGLPSFIVFDNGIMQATISGGQNKNNLTSFIDKFV